MVLKTREAPSREYVDIRFSFMLGGGLAAPPVRLLPNVPDLLKGVFWNVDFRRYILSQLDIVLMSHHIVSKLEDKLEMNWRKKKMAKGEQERHTRRVLRGQADEELMFLDEPIQTTCTK
ncbi:hypothetical protein FRC14_004992 [Serendipita sp. 396]|nr:hypothetical protein FRC14_004992 [Serendipita sp. 396]